ncbi:DYW domain containing protein [Fagus crenata]
MQLLHTHQTAPSTLSAANSNSALPTPNCLSSALSNPSVTFLMPPTFSAKSKTHQPTVTPLFEASPLGSNPPWPSHAINYQTMSRKSPTRIDALTCSFALKACARALARSKALSLKFRFES